MIMALSLLDHYENDNPVDDKYDEYGKFDEYNGDDHENYLAEGYKLPQLPTEHVPWLHAGFVHHPLGPGGDHDHDHVLMVVVDDEW